MKNDNNKLKKRKYQIGYKTLKNVPLFEEFKGKVNNKAIFDGNFRSEFNNVFYDLNILDLLFDGGYLANNGTIKSDLNYMDLNYFLEKEVGQDFFDSDDSVEAWVVNTIENLRQFVNKY